MAYAKKDWTNGEVIQEAAMDNIENGIAANDTKNTEQDGRIGQIESKLVKAVAGSKDGLMSKEDKTKLDAIAANANNYVLPAAGSGLGGVKKATKVDPVAKADATAVSGTYTKAEIDKIVELANDNKKKINEILTVLKASGAMADA